MNVLSKEGFKYHVNNIDHYTLMANAYKKSQPMLAKKCLQIVDESKRTLLDYYEKVNTE